MGHGKETTSWVALSAGLSGPEELLSSGRAFIKGGGWAGRPPERVAGVACGHCEASALVETTLGGWGNSLANLPCVLSSP